MIYLGRDVVPPKIQDFADRSFSRLSASAAQLVPEPRPSSWQRPPSQNFRCCWLLLPVSPHWKRCRRRPPYYGAASAARSAQWILLGRPTSRSWASSFSLARRCLGKFFFSRQTIALLAGDVPLNVDGRVFVSRLMMLLWMVRNTKTSGGSSWGTFVMLEN